MLQILSFSYHSHAPCIFCIQTSNFQSLFCASRHSSAFLGDISFTFLPYSIRPLTLLTFFALLRFWLLISIHFPATGIVFSCLDHKHFCVFTAWWNKTYLI